MLQRRVVALAEQLEAPIPNKLVRRDVVRVVTPGTVIEEQMLEPGAHAYLAAIAAVDDAVALAHADVSTGHVMATAFSGESAFDEVLAEIARLDPAELVADISAAARAALERALENAQTRIVTPPLAIVTGAVAPIDGFSQDESLAIRRTLEALGAFVRRVGVPQAVGEAFRPPRFYSQNAFLALDAQHAQASRTAPRAGGQPEGHAARDDRPHAHRDGLAVARALAFGTADRAARDRRASRLRRGAS